MTCINCGHIFVKKNKGYIRFSAEKDIEMISDIFKHESRICDRDLKGLFFCSPCHSAIIHLRKSSDTFKSTLHVLSGIIKSTDILDECNDIPRKIPRTVTPIFQWNCSHPTTQLWRRKHDISLMARGSFRAKAVEAILGSRYKAALKFLLRSSISFRKSFIEKVAHITRAEIRCLAKTSTELRKPLCENTIEHFSWGKVDEEIQKICPLLHAVLEPALTDFPFQKKKSSDVHMKQFGVVISIFLHFVKPGTFKLFQCLNSVELKRSGCQQKTLNYLHHLGLNMSIKTTRRLVAKVKADLGHGDGARSTLGVEPQDEENTAESSDGDTDGDEGDDMEMSSGEEEVEISSEEEVDLDMEVFEVPDEEQADGRR